MRDALLIVDVLDDFAHEDGDALLSSFAERQPLLIRLLEGARTSGIPIVFANDNKGVWDSDVRQLIERALEGPGGALVRAVVPRSGERFVFKPRYSAFDHTPLELILEELACERLLVAGMTTEGCVAQSAIAARELGLKVSVIPGACATLDSGVEAVALRYLGDVVGVELADVDLIDSRAATPLRDPDRATGPSRLFHPAGAGDEAGPSQTTGGAHVAEITDPRELFVHKLGEALNMERSVLTMLKRNRDAAQDAEVERLFAHHLTETEGQVANLEQAFSALGEEPKGHTCYGMDGMKKEAQDMIDKIAPELLDGALAGAATHVEHYEIATYRGLLTDAEAMGEDDIVALLQENLEQEQQTLAKVESAATRLAQRATSGLPSTSR
jgi:ferritin-like metal-binding protein YciE/nicotinamidase-related amidase